MNANYIVFIGSNIFFCSKERKSSLLLIHEWQTFMHHGTYKGGFKNLKHCGIWLISLEMAALYCKSQMSKHKHKCINPKNNVNYE